APARRSRCWRTTVSRHRQTRLQAPGPRPCSVCRSSALLENFPYTLRLLPPRAMPPLMQQFTARRRLRRSTLFPGSGQAVGSDFQEPPETPAAVVRVRAVVVDEHAAVAAIAEQGPAESPHVLRRLDP